MWDNRCRLTEVKDGDTVEIYVDDAKERYSDEAVRLFGVFAPEKTDVGGPETKAFVAAWITVHDDGSEWPFIRVSMRNKGNTKEQTTFNRYVGMIWSRDLAHCLNVEVSNFVQAQGYSGGTGA